MLVTIASECSLLSLMGLARQSATMLEIVEENGFARGSLKQTFAKLRAAGLVQFNRGIWRLGDDPRAVSVLDVVETVQPFPWIRVLSSSQDVGGLERAFQRLEKMERRELAAITLADLVQGRPTKRPPPHPARPTRKPRYSLLTAESQYGLFALLTLARVPDSVVSASKIAAEHDLPVRYIRNIVPAFKRIGAVETAAGWTGGYRLARAPGEISLWEVFEAIAPLASVRIATQSEDGAVLTRKLRCVDAAEEETLRGMMLADLLDAVRPRR